MTAASSHIQGEEGVVSRESHPPCIKSEGHSGVAGRVAMTGKENLPLA
jgi:hypothetical protein